MSTNAAIAIEDIHGTIHSIYCHHDGYFGHVGKILHEYYTKESKIFTLIGLGNISSLGVEIGKAHDFHKYFAQDGVVNAFGRDLGETDTEARVYSSRKEWLEVEDYEYSYLFHGEWLVSQRGEPLCPLREFV